jgi:hypothetical protein
MLKKSGLRQLYNDDGIALERWLTDRFYSAPRNEEP